MLHRARARHDQLVRADSCRLPFADDTFDVVLSRSLLHHLPDPEQGIREMARVLRPGGEVVAMDTNKTIMSDLPRRVANRSRHFDEGHQNFVASELASRFARHLEVDKVDFRGYLAYPLLAFPDLLDFSRVLPLGLLTAPLLRLDSMLARVPALRRLGWALIVKAHKAS
jgi:ubiquinone/menaquinone biosynthesis C-methylase UbiE